MKTIIEANPKVISTATESVPVGISPTTIEIDRDTFMELINNRIRNDTETIKHTIEDSIMHVYSGTRDGI
jgi:hypothetical protein